MIRILQIYPQMNNAGTEMVIMNLYRNIDRNQVQFDFCVQKEGELDDKIRSMGGIIYYLKERNYYHDFYELLKSHPEYHIVHTHTHKEMGMELKIAKKAGVPYRIAHSHNFRGDLPWYAKLYKIFSSHKVERYSTHKLACSREAAKWLYPITYKNAVVWNNGIDLLRFRFNEKARNNIRIQYNIPENAFVICHIGRFARQKNHERIVELLNEMMSQNENVFAFLVGCGPLEEEIKSKSKFDRIKFLGNRTDVPDILSASDVFLFPSLWEGLGIVAVEAQASGMFCFASERVPSSADLGVGLFRRINLSEPNKTWIDALYKFNNRNRIEKSQKAGYSNYDIKKVADIVQRFYMELDKNDKK